jgi:acyl-homoserine-lactone acylase
VSTFVPWGIIRMCGPCRGGRKNPVKHIIALVAAVGLVSPAGLADAAQDRGPEFSAVIRYTENGVPHIRANSYAGVGFGDGYAMAMDNVCAIADIYVTLNARRSRYFGPDGPGNPAVGSASTNLNSDLYFQQVNDSRAVEGLVAQPAPLGPQREVRDVVRGYVAGYNKYLAENRITDPACKGAPWVRPIGEMDVYREIYALANIQGGGVFIDSIATTQPPTTARVAPPLDPAKVREALESTKTRGSNAIALGRDATVDGHSALVGNPHYPWHGGNRFWQTQLTVPGRMDVTGGSLLGLPFVQIGYNEDMAWSHTVATPVTFGLFQLNLVDPTTYLVDGRPEAMTSRKVSVQVRGDDGSLSTVERTLWSTRYGPVIGSGLNLPVDWTPTTAFAVKDANVTNVRSFNTWFQLGRAHSTSEVTEVLSSTLGVPWVNTIAADRAGNALYADIQTVPNIPDALAAKCNTDLGKETFAQFGVAVLDGSTTACGWTNDPDAVVPGLMSPSKLPRQTRGDYVVNANDSAWLANLHAPITGYPRIVGDINTERGPRTRMALSELDGKKFTRQSLQDMAFSDRSFIANTAVDDTVRMCRTMSGVADACDALAKWDRKYTTSSKGALLFDRFWGRTPDDEWTVPFNAADPVNTPRGLAADNPLVRRAFTDAVAELRAAGIPLDAPLGDHQYVTRNGEKISIPGGRGGLGVLNVTTPAQWNNGYTEVVHGSSYVQTVAFTNSPCPDAQTILTYSQSSDPTSPHFADQTKLYSQGKWNRGRFCERDILSSPDLKVLHLHS